MPYTGASTLPLIRKVPSSDSRDERFAIRQTLRVKMGGCLSDMLGVEKIKVNCMHRQAVGRLGPQLEVEAVTDDGTVGADRWGNARRFAIPTRPDFSRVRRCGSYPRSDEDWRIASCKML
ncbi:gamma-glutamyl-gamma-aminobutyrate hydrolase family protein [Mesorhizobium sp. M0189]|uniref:gamma-glutamyl-gamma-aminobutyrate hydrolase family protein n=1 Tax=Mesorhizobium sp. M0189 TaxID=2956909 RepID=UPI0033359369